MRSRAQTQQKPNTRFSRALDSPEELLTERQRRWLRPRRLFATVAYALLYFVNLVVIRLIFRVSVEGRRHLPASGPFILMPNHSSAFDPPILAAVFPLKMLRNTLWAGKQSTVLHTRLRVLLSWLTRVIPINNESSLAVAVTILNQKKNLVWFPEGRRSTDGKLQSFKPGIAMILTRCDVPVVPVYIDGAYAAFPTGARFPRWRAPIVVRIGEPQLSERPRLPSLSDSVIEPVVENLRQQVVRLRDG